MGRGRVIPANTEVQIAIVSGPDPMSQMLANSLAFATSTSSPMSAGRHTSGTDRGFSGLDGHGVNRWAGDSGPLQHFAGAAASADPSGKRLGIGTGASGQPGLPGTGEAASSLAWLGFTPGGRAGIGG